MIDLKYIVTGTGRCGTVYMARLLTSVGVPCGHETIFDNLGFEAAQMKLAGLSPMCVSHISLMEYQTTKDQWVSVPDWSGDLKEIVADSSYMAAPFLDQFPNAKVVQVTRNPIKVIDSFVNHLDYFFCHYPTNQWEHFIYQHLPELKENLPAYDRAALFYILWNQMIEGHADLRCKIEDGPNTILEFVGKVGHPHYNEKVNSVRKMNKRVFTLDGIESKEIANRLKQKADEYGYKITSEYLMI